MSKGDTYDVDGGGTSPDDAATAGMATRPPAEDRPGGVRSLLFDLHRQSAAVAQHQFAEGADVRALTVFESYDRQLHPWLHGRRPEDIAAKVREVLGL